MTWGCLVLRRVTGKRPPQRTDKGKSTGLGVQHQAFSFEWPLGFEIGSRSGRIAVLEAPKGNVGTKPFGKTDPKHATAVVGSFYC